MLNIIDACIILFLGLGAVWGFKRGVIRTAVSFVGTIVIIILAFYLKNPLSTLLYTYLPFFKFSGLFAGVSVLNILIYEAISFLIVFLILKGLLNLIIKLTRAIEGFLKATVVLAIPSKILGLILGLLESYLIIFLILTVLAHFNFSSEVTMGSKYGNKILNNTPFLSNQMDGSFKSIDEIYSLKDNYKNTSDKSAYNLEALDILMKNEVIDTKSANKLVEKGKLPNNAKTIIDKYEVK